MCCCLSAPPPPLAAVRKIYKTDLKTQIKKIEDFVHDGKYLCCSGEKPAESAKLPAPFQTA